MTASTAQAFTASMERWLGLHLRSEYDQATAVERGVPLSSLENMLRLGLRKDELFGTVIPERTLKHRRLSRSRLTTAESDRAIRLARLLSQAETVFGNPEKALRWMRHPLRRFGDRTPMQIVATEAGGRVVEELLIQIDEGIFA